SSRGAAPPASRSAPSAPPGGPSPPRAATRTRRRRSCPSRRRPAAAAASAAYARGRRRSRGSPSPGTASERTEAPCDSARSARRVDGGEVGGRVGLADVVRLDVEPEATGLAAEADAHAGLQAVSDPRLVEPGGRDRRGAVEDARGDEGAAPAQGSLVHVQDLAD